MGLVNEDESEVSNRGEESTAGANDDLGSGVFEDAFPDLVAFGLGEARMEDFRGKLVEILDELRSEGDFRDEENDGFSGL